MHNSSYCMEKLCAQHFIQQENNISKMLMWVFSVVHTDDVLSIAQETMGTYLGVLRFSYTTLFIISMALNF